MIFTFKMEIPLPLELEIMIYDWWIARIRKEVFNTKRLSIQLNLMFPTLVRTAFYQNNQGINHRHFEHTVGKRHKWGVCTYTPTYEHTYYYADKRTFIRFTFK